DTTDNGLKNNDAGVPGVTVSIFKSDGTLLNTTTTNSNGEYSFSGIPAKTLYYINFSTSGTGQFSPPSQGTWDNSSQVTQDNSGSGNINGQTPTFEADGTITNLNAGIYFGSNNGNINGNIFNDINGNGYAD